MKKIIIILLLLICFVIDIFSQRNILVITFTNVDCMFGLQYTRKIPYKLSVSYEKSFFKSMGLYVNSSYGIYKGDHSAKANHIKTGIGITKFIRNNNGVTATTFSGGIIGHYYFNIDQGAYHITEYDIFPASLELGMGEIINQVNFDFKMDPIKNSLIFTFGILF